MTNEKTEANEPVQEVQNTGLSEQDIANVTGGSAATATTATKASVAPNGGTNIRCTEDMVGCRPAMPTVLSKTS